MAQDMHIKPGGLFTDPSAVSSAPPGALRRADNVVIRRDGVAQPRPGFEAVTVSAYNGDSYDVIALIPYDGELLALVQGGGTTGQATRWVSNLGATVRHRVLNEIPFYDTFPFAAEARQNLYLTTSYGITRISGGGRVDSDDSATSKAWEQAGNPASLAVTVSDSGVAGTTLVTGSVIAYRVTVRTSRIGNPLDVMSSPSGRAVYKNVSGATRNPVLTVVFPEQVLAGDVLEVYRSPVTTADTPDDNMQLVTSYTLLSTDITAGYWSFTDGVAVEALGKFLYTSPNQEGLVAANYLIPRAKDVALFRGALFGANLQHSYSETVTYDMGGTALTTDTGIGRRTKTTCRRTNGSAVITVTNTTGLRVGQILSARSSWSGSGVVRITSIATNTSVTMNTTWTGASDGMDVSLTFKDTICVDGDYYDATSPGTMVAGVVTQYATTDGVVDDPLWTATVIGDGQRYRSDGADWTIANAQVVFSYLFPYKGTAPTIWATHGDEYKPALPITSGFARNMESESIANGLAWSKDGQPEHWPLGYATRVGGETHPILRIVPTRDALWIFKTDGIWRLTGSGPPNWRIDPVDMTTYLLAPKAVAVMDDVVYAWTNKGVVAVSDAGISRVSALAIGVDLRETEIGLGAGNTTTLGAWMAANPKDSEVLLGVGGASDDCADAVYVFNAKAQAWTKWLQTEWTAVAYDPSTRKLYAANGADTQTAMEVWSERLAFDRLDTSDGAYSTVYVSDDDAYVVTLDVSGYTPVAGDLGKTASGYAIVESVSTVSAGRFAITFSVSDFSNSGERAITLYASYEACIEPVARTGNNASALKHCTEGSWVFGKLDDVASIYLDHTSELSGTATTETRDITLVSGGQPRPVRFLVPRAHAKSSQYWPRLRIRQAGGDWELNQVSIFYRPLSSRVSR